MSESNLNSELLSADLRGRKHIPYAIFAVVLVHIILFVFLLVAAGCRAKARALRNAQPVPGLVGSEIESGAPDAMNPLAIAPENAGGRTTPPESTPQSSTVRGTAEPGPESGSIRVYTVKSGDTVEKIARMHGTSIEAIKTENNLKNHLIWPGQKLRVNTEKRKSSDEA